MSARRGSSDSPRRRQVKIMPPVLHILQKRMHDAVAWRAFRLYEARGCSQGHQAEDWSRAEAEVIRPLNGGMIVEEDCVCLTTDMSCFAPGVVELWVEPHRITLCGPRAEENPEPPAEAATGAGEKNWIFRTHDVTAELDPTGVTVRFNGPAMHVYLHRALPTPQQAAEAHAA